MSSATVRSLAPGAGSCAASTIAAISLRGRRAGRGGVGALPADGGGKGGAGWRQVPTTQHNVHTRQRARLASSLLLYASPKSMPSLFSKAGDVCSSIQLAGLCLWGGAGRGRAGWQGVGRVGKISEQMRRAHDAVLLRDDTSPTRSPQLLAS